MATMTRSLRQMVALAAVSGLVYMSLGSELTKTGSVSGTTTTTPTTTTTSTAQTLSLLTLGLLLGLLIGETPLAHSIVQALGLTSSPLISQEMDRIGMDILHGSSLKGIEEFARVQYLELETRNLKKKKKHMYGLQHAFLNMEVTGWWFNMGYWKRVDKEGRGEKDEGTVEVVGAGMLFRDACKALVRKVTEGLEIGPTSHILDVGFGCGDQDVYIAQLYKPSRITGLTIEPIQHHVAQEMLNRTPTPGTLIDLHVADASLLPTFMAKQYSSPSSSPSLSGTSDSSSSSSSSSSPLLARSSNNSSTSPLPPSTPIYFSHVLSIDAAYHFQTRKQFLMNASMFLTPGGKGRLGLADMVLAKPVPNSGLGKKFYELIMDGLEVPLENMKSLEEYRQDLEESGFEEIEIECIEDFVFAGLARHVEEQGEKFGGMINVGMRWQYWGLAKALRWLERSKWLHFVIVKARKS